MIFGTIICLLSAFLLLLDYAHVFVEKKRKVSFYTQCFIWGVIFIAFRGAFFREGTLYSDGGVKVDILTFLLLSREAILARIRQSETRQAITCAIRRQSLLNALSIPQLASTPSRQRETGAWIGNS